MVRTSTSAGKWCKFTQIIVEQGTVMPTSGPPAIMGLFVKDMAGPEKADTEMVLLPYYTATIKEKASPVTTCGHKRVAATD